MSVQAVFLDKDATLVENIPYNVDPERIRLAPGVAAGIPLLHVAGYRLVVITNQSGVARGYFTEKALRPVEAKLRDLLTAAGGYLAGFYYCPHHPQGSVSEYAVVCACRKPEAGLFFRAAIDHNIDLGRSWMVGDVLDDVEAGRRAGCRTILINNGSETEWLLSSTRLPHFIVNDMAEAAQLIVSQDRVGYTWPGITQEGAHEWTPL